MSTTSNTELRSDLYQDMPDAQQVCGGVNYFKTPHRPFWHRILDGEVYIAMRHVQLGLDEGERKYEEYMTEMNREYELEMRHGGRSRCPKCNQFEVEHREVCTYGMGHSGPLPGAEFSDYAKCRACGYSDLAG